MPERQVSARGVPVFGIESFLPDLKGTLGALFERSFLDETLQGRLGTVVALLELATFPGLLDDLEAGQD